MDNNRRIAKQKFDEHFMFKENPIAWAAWKMAFQFGVEHGQTLHKYGVLGCKEFLLEQLRSVAAALETMDLKDVNRRAQLDRKHAIDHVLQMISEQEVLAVGGNKQTVKPCVANVHNLDVMYLGCCSKCGGTSFRKAMDAADGVT